MSPRRLPSLAALALVALSGPLTAARAQVGPADSARQVQAAEGLEATLWAAEPMVVNPTTIDVDSRGRVWVTEGLNYRLSRGRNKPMTKVDEADRIKILADTDGDGKADKVTVFADHIFPVPMGIAVEERYDRAGRYAGCKVYVGNSPNVLVLEDTDGDDRADARYPLLTGFGGIDSDHGVHGMIFGPDGKLYFTHGDGCCSVQPDQTEKVQNFDVTDAGGRRVWSDQLANTLRVNRDGTQFEILADRQRNNYETCLSSFGAAFTSDNDDDGRQGCRVIWIMDGGRYGYRTPGSPRHWGEEVPGNVPKLVGTGNGSPCGIMLYEGSLLPAPFRGALLEADAGTRQINLFPLTRAGAAYRTEAKVFLKSADPWFRPVDATAAPDGAVFVADWYDAGVGGHAFRDQTTGRIYRVTPKGVTPTAATYDFGSTAGLVAALGSPAVATRDAAFRGLADRLKAEGDAAVRDEARAAIRAMATAGPEVLRARASWVLAAAGDLDPVFALLKVREGDPRLREQAVRILGRDVARVGHVEPKTDAARAATDRRAAEAHLDRLLPLADDPDAGVRRELILALRDLPTAKVGPALRTLAARWDGQDRWYLEALGLALRGREPAFLAELFDGSLYGELDLASLGGVGAVALPPYFPVDRNEAFLAASDPAPAPANPLSKTLGLIWQVHPAAALPLLTRIMPTLKAPELQQAADDALMQVTDPEGAVALARLLQGQAPGADASRRRQVLATLGRKLEGDWKAARGEAAVEAAILAALADPGLRGEAIATAAATGEARYAAPVKAILEAADAPVETRVAAVEALARLKPADVAATFDGLIRHAVEAKSSDPLAEAAVRSLPRLGPGADRLVGLVTDAETPLGLRREAVRALVAQGGGPERLIALAKEGRLPADLKTDASLLLNSTPTIDQKLRAEAARVLPLPSVAGGKPLPPFFELVRREGDAVRGRAVFFGAHLDGRSPGVQSCGSCHRVQGRGQWVGPDLSTIGTKYGKDELLRSILSPGAAIGYNYRSLVLATTSGQVLTGLPIESDATRIVLKTADGRRVTVPTAEVEQQAYSDVSLMPEGLAQSMGEADLVDLVAYLATLRQPVSIVGEFQSAGPLAADGPVDPERPAPDAAGAPQPWRRLNADAEGAIDLAALSGPDPKRAGFLHAPVVSAAAQPARLVIDGPAGVQVWLGGNALTLPQATTPGEPRELALDLPAGRSDLLLRVPGGTPGRLVVTFVTGKPLEFTAAAPSR
jgi:putative membrane-bound dehydrogenase-like protein